MEVSAPTKIILFGEHYVVYGAPALSVAVDKRRVVELRESESDQEDMLIIKNPTYKEEGIAYPNGKWEGHRHVAMHAAIYKEIYGNTGKLKGYRITAEFKGERIFKGMGGSSALGACIAKGLYKIVGIDANEEEVFRCAQIGDEVDHGGRPSGIDARTVVHGGMIKFWREFNPDRFNFEKMKIELPEDTTIIIVDTYMGERCNTGDMVLLFAKNHSVIKKPAEMKEEERKKVIQPYLKIYESALNHLNRNGDAQQLGNLMNENHNLLKRAGVSTPEIEDAINIILHNGGLGAKITGAGGKGGALIGYVWKDDLEKIENLLNRKGFDTLELRPTNQGVTIH